MIVESFNLIFQEGKRTNDKKIRHVIALVWS